MGHMFEKPRCKCPRCIHRRRTRCLTVSGLCAAVTAGYFTFAMAERRQSAPDLLLQNTGGLADLPSSDLTSVSAGNPEPIAESPNPPETERPPASLSESGQY